MQMSWCSMTSELELFECKYQQSVFFVKTNLLSLSQQNSVSQEHYDCFKTIMTGTCKKRDLLMIKNLGTDCTWWENLRGVEKMNKLKVRWR